MGGASIELAESIKKKGKEKKYHYSEKGKRRKKTYSTDLLFPVDDTRS